jgi:endogenous inhibitor of DNA gyrase (YacG/DUF329 family)
MAARNATAPRPKSVLFCPRCNHESTLPGDWQVEEVGTDIAYTCPTCETTVVEQPRRLLA